MMTSKDKTIKNILKNLKKVSPFDGVEFVDYWDGDRCAVGFKKDNKLVYISTHTFVSEGRKGDVTYDYDFELVDEQDEDDLEGNLLKEVRGIDEAMLLKDIKEFLETQVDDYIAKFKILFINRGFPSEFRKKTVKEALLSKNTRVRKLIFRIISS